MLEFKSLKGYRTTPRWIDLGEVIEIRVKLETEI